MKLTFLTPKQLAMRLGVSVCTLRSWRVRGTGPAFLKPPGRNSAVRYKLEDVEAWERDHTRNHD